MSRQISKPISRQEPQTVPTYSRDNKRLFILNSGQMYLPRGSYDPENTLIYNEPGGTLFLGGPLEPKISDPSHSPCHCTMCDSRYLLEPRDHQLTVTDGHSDNRRRVSFAPRDQELENCAPIMCPIRGCTSGKMRFRTHREWESHFNQEHSDLRPKQLNHRT